MRPTPAPSSPGAERDQRYRDDEDVFVDQRREHLRTPESLPNRRTLQTDEQQPALANTVSSSCDLVYPLTFSNALHRLMLWRRKSRST